MTASAWEVSRTIALDQMSAQEKLQIMEDLWDDLSRRAEDIPFPAWHRELLAEREARVKSGEETFEDWDLVKKRTRARHS